MDCLNEISEKMANAIYKKHQKRKFGFNIPYAPDADYLFDLYELYKTALELSEEDLMLCQTCERFGELIKTA